MESEGKFHLILTLDYELFGNGSGCLEHCLIRPSQRSFEIVNRHDAVMTFFVEALEFERMRKLGFSGINKVEDQLKMLAGCGNELALHLHPQWHGATRANSEWQLDFSKWRIGDIDEMSLSEMFETGHAYLQSFSNGEPITVFRAGGWAIQPASRVLNVMKKHGYLIDSTVAPGLFMLAKGDWFDFRSYPDAPYWNIQDDVCEPSKSNGLLEVPIASSPIEVLKHLKLQVARRGLPAFPDGCSGSYEGPNGRVQNLIGKLTKLASLDRIMLDFSTLPSDTLIGIVESTIHYRSATPGPIPIVAIGHNKNFTEHSAKQLESLLDWTKSRPEISISTYAEWYASHQNWQQEKASSGELASQLDLRKS